MNLMKFTHSLIVSGGLCLLCACSTVPTNAPTAQQTAPPKPLTVPISKNWKLIEEAPNLSDERGHVPFQTEQSIQPAGSGTPVAPTENRKLETPR